MWQEVRPSLFSPMIINLSVAGILIRDHRSLCGYLHETKAKRSTKNSFINAYCKAGNTENCRLVFGEADSLPQLIIDKFNEYFVIQTLALGIDICKPAIVNALNKIFNPKGIYERNDVPVREVEGMSQQKGFLSAPFETNILINENGLKFNVDIENGQKTGYFLDPVSYTHLRAHETPEHLVCRLLLEK